MKGLASALKRLGVSNKVGLARFSLHLFFILLMQLLFAIGSFSEDDHNDDIEQDKV